jgi:hypothetical protein
MRHKSRIICVLAASAVSLVARSEVPQATSNLSAAQIVERNVAARGGLQAWRGVQTMSLTGKLPAGGNRRTAMPVTARRPNEQAQTPLPARPTEEVQLPFVMELKRPHKMRFELEFNGQTALQVFDGTNGWKWRPFLNRKDVEPFTPEEMKMSSMQADLDGPLIDYKAKGTRIELVGTEKVENRDTYKLKLIMTNGSVVHVWIDAQTFLEAKIEGQPRQLDGVSHPVQVYFRDYRPVSGLQIPFVLETKVLPAESARKGVKDVSGPGEKTVIEKVVVNPKIDESHFAKPQVELASR